MKTDGEAIAAIQAQMNDVQTNITEIKSDIKSILVNLAATGTQNALLNKEVTELQREINDLKTKSGFWRWMSPTLAAAAGSVLTFLFINFLTNSK